MSASALLRTSVANAASISLLSLAWTRSIATAMMDAAAVISLVAVWAFALLGLNSSPTRRGNKLPQQTEMLRPQFGEKEVRAGRIAARSGNARDEAERYWIIGRTEYDRNIRRCAFSRECWKTGGRDDRGHLAAHQFFRHQRQPIVLPLGETVIDRHVAALDVPDLVQALPQRIQLGRRRRLRSRAQIGDHRHHRLLRARCERPGDGRAADQRYELAPFHRDDPKPKDYAEYSRSRPCIAAKLPRLCPSWGQKPLK